MVVVGFVHLVDQDRHPTMAGWRWAVHVGANPYNLASCMQAGHSITEADAREQVQWFVGAVANTITLLTGTQPEYAIQLLDHDPIPDGADRVKLI